ncbi:MBL fold metallo-hydrolase [Halobacteriovorax sp. HLS]|uniref:MBL fold metallo-hydrolase n=1 Tax=Halobacteriovorax sp. HLS TaxID=2234000 RepID=UPI000FD94861|nr:MBL fold metallo-hydrolase [Halobacteriovorax sp. HLS]
MNNIITILGSGTSTGIPMLGCKCEICQSDDPMNKRLRTSIYIETAKGLSFIVDTGPDLRTQLLNNKIEKVDFAFITHDHADHVHGIDDLRPFCFGPPAREIPIYTHSACKIDLEKRFPYIFQRDKVFTSKNPILGGGIPSLNLEEIDENKPLTIGEDKFDFLLLNHGNSKTLGIIHSGFAYIIDCHELTQEQVQYLNSLSLELLIIDCVTSLEHKTHLSKTKAFEYIEQISPKRAGLIHMGHFLEHNKLAQEAKNIKNIDVFVTYDSMQIKY